MIFRLLASPAYYAVQLFLPVKSLKWGWDLESSGASHLKNGAWNLESRGFRSAILSSIGSRFHLSSSLMSHFSSLFYYARRPNPSSFLFSLCDGWSGSGDLTEFLVPGSLWTFIMISLFQIPRSRRALSGQSEASQIECAAMGCDIFRCQPSWQAYRPAIVLGYNPLFCFLRLLSQPLYADGEITRGDTAYHRTWPTMHNTPPM